MNLLKWISFVILVLIHVILLIWSVKNENKDPTDNSTNKNLVLYMLSVIIIMLLDFIIGTILLLSTVSDHLGGI